MKYKKVLLPFSLFWESELFWANVVLFFDELGQKDVDQNNHFPNLDQLDLGPAPSEGYNKHVGCDSAVNGIYQMDL